jgi:hypothetical protein
VFIVGVSGNNSDRPTSLAPSQTVQRAESGQFAALADQFFDGHVIRSAGWS